MKKLIFTMLTMGVCFSYIQAQSLNSRYPLIKDMDASTKKASKARISKTDVSSWYSPGGWTLTDATVGTGMKNYVDFMHHDSTTKSVMMYSSGETVVTGLGSISIGQVCDPKDDVIDYSSDPQIKLSKFVGYSVDSIHFLYRYVRNADSLSDGLGGKIPVVDTLFVHYFKGTQIAKSGLTFTGPPQRSVKYAFMNWTGGGVRLPASAFYVDTILLTKADSTSALNVDGFENRWNAKEMTLPAPAGLSSAANQDNNLVAFALTFKSAIPTTIGTDTAIMIYQKDPATLAPGTRRTNYFGFSLLVNEGTNKWANPTYYNSSLFVEPISAYTPWVVNSSITFNGFIPGMIYTQERFVDFDFHITTNTDNVGIKEIKNNEFAMSSVYPNPARSYESPVVAFNLAKSASVSISIMNMVGAEVKTGVSKTYTAGSHADNIDITGLKAGVYFVNMTVNGASISKKLTIVE